MPGTLTRRREDLGPKLDASLSSLKKKASRVLFWRALASVCLFLCAAALVSFFLDWSIELPWIARLVILILVAFGALKIFFAGRRRARLDVEDRELLATVENSRPALDGHLVNWVEFEEQRRAEAASPPGTRPPDRALETVLRERAAAESRRVVEGVRFQRALDDGPLRWQIALAALALFGLACLAASFPALAGHWARRDLLLGTDSWPRATHFSLERQDPVWHHPRRAPLEVVGWVLGEVPRDVWVHIDNGKVERRSRLVTGVQRRRTWQLSSSVAAGGPAADEVVDGHRLVHPIAQAMESFDLWLAGGDNESHRVRVEVHDRPRILSTRIELVYPEYAGLEARTLTDPAGELSAVIGTRVRIEATSDGPLREAWVRFGRDGRLPVEDCEGSSFRYEFVLTESGFFEYGVRDRDYGFSSLPRKLAFIALPDEPPSVTLEIDGNSRAVTPTGSIAYLTTAVDDFGFSSIDLLVHDLGGVSQASEDASEGGDDSDDTAGPTRISLAPWQTEPTAEGKLRVRLERLFDLTPLAFEPGQEIGLQIEVADNFRRSALESSGETSADEPGETTKASEHHLARTPIEIFRVVSPDELRAEMDRVRVQSQEKLKELSAREAELIEEIEEVARLDPEVLAERNRERREQREQREGGERPRGTGEESGSREGTEAASSSDAGDASARRERGSENENERGSENENENERGSENANERGSENENERGSENANERGSENPSERGQEGARNSQSPQGQQPSPRQEALEQIAEEQERLAEESRDVASALEEMNETLDRNQLLDEAEQKRFDEEVRQPLEELNEDRLPKSAEDIQKASEEQEASEQERAEEALEREMQRIAESLDDVAKTLAGSGDFREVLHRLEAILEIQNQVIEGTRGVESKAE